MVELQKAESPLRAGLWQGFVRAKLRHPNVPTGGSHAARLRVVGLARVMAPFGSVLARTWAVYYKPVAVQSAALCGRWPPPLRQAQPGPLAGPDQRGRRQIKQGGYLTQRPALADELHASGGQRRFSARHQPAAASSQNASHSSSVRSPVSTTPTRLTRRSKREPTAWWRALGCWCRVVQLSSRWLRFSYALGVMLSSTSSIPGRNWPPHSGQARSMQLS